MVLRMLLSLSLVWCQCCEGCHGLLPSRDQLSGVSSDRKACLSVLLHRALLWCALLWSAIRSKGMPPQPPPWLPIESLWVTGWQRGHQVGAVPGTLAVCVHNSSNRMGTEGTERKALYLVWGQEITTLSWHFEEYAELICIALIKYMLPSYKLLIGRKNIFYGIL